jgi:hypothetical protein
MSDSKEHERIDVLIGMNKRAKVVKLKQIDEGGEFTVVQKSAV